MPQTPQIKVFAITDELRNREGYAYEFIQRGQTSTTTTRSEIYVELSPQFFNDLKGAIFRVGRTPAVRELSVLVSERPFIMGEHEVNPRMLNGAEWAKLLEGVTSTTRTY